MRDNVGDLSGQWGVCAGPSYGFGGGTFIGISSLSNRKEQAWDFIKFVCFNEDTADWWIETSQGDTVSLLSALDKHANDANDIYGGEHLYSFWLEQAKGIDYSKVTQYDKVIGDAWGAAIGSIKTGEMNKEDAISNFYDTVQSTYPDLTINR
jgi:multiple sugar transport system substrate-binding protein